MTSLQVGTEMISGLIQNACLGGVAAFCVDQVLPPRAFLFKGGPPEPDPSATLSFRGTQEGLWSIGRLLLDLIIV